jgi:hypothetical protein
LDYQRRRLVLAAASDQYPKQRNSNRNERTLQPVRPAKTREALVAKSPAGPNTPAQTHELVTAFRAEIWTIIREERQVL